MAAFEVPCPQCGRKLKIADRALLGRKARCAVCGHRFILHDPDDAKSAAAEESPPVRIEFASIDEVEASEGGALAAGGGIPESGVFPACDESFARAVSTVAGPAGLPGAEDPAAASFPSISDDGDEAMAARVRKRQIAARRRRRNFLIAAAVVALAAGGVVTYLGTTGRLTASTKGRHAADSMPPKHSPADELAEEGASDAAAASHEVQPITLQFVPDGARVIVHLRPAELWRDDAREFRACLGPLGVWLEKTIRERCLLEPAAIEEVLFALIPASRDEFDVAVVVRSRHDLKKSELIDKFEGELVDRPKPHYVGKERAWFVRDARTLASAPKAMAASMIEAEDSSVSSDGVLALLPHTNRKRHFTLLCELEDVRLGARSLAPQNAQNLVEGIVDFFGDDVETIAWSVRLGDSETGGPLSSELLVRNRLSRAVPKLEADLKKKLGRLPKDLLDLVYRTHKKTVGETKIVGRFPAMTKVVERSTRFDEARRMIAMHVELPDRAGPNLAIGALLTWEQTTRPDFSPLSGAPAASVAARPNLPAKIADRLQKKISVEFHNDFLYSALDFISGEIGVKFVLDGPGMKEVGATQNEKQDFAMENISAAAVLDKMLTAKKLVLIVDEDKKTATVTSQAGADRMKRKPFPLTSR
jgi:hypothetical protein